MSTAFFLKKKTVLQNVLFYSCVSFVTSVYSFRGTLQIVSVYFALYAINRSYSKAKLCENIFLKVLAEKVHVKALTIAQRVNLLQQGLNDRSGKIFLF